MIADRIKMLRETKNISQAELAKKLGMDEENIPDRIEQVNAYDLLYVSKEDRKDEETISPISQELNISKQKRALESLKSELLEEQKTVQSVQTDKGPTLSKRKK